MMRSLLITLAVALSSCTYNRRMAMSSGTLGANQRAVGVVRGESEKDYYFGGIFQSGDDSLESAVRDALSRSTAPAQGLIGVFAEKSCSFIPILPGFYFWCNTTVFGTAVQDLDLGNLRIKKTAAPDVAAQSTVVSCRDDENYELGRCVPRIPGK